MKKNLEQIEFMSSLFMLGFIMQQPKESWPVKQDPENKMCTTSKKESIENEEPAIKV